MFVRNQRLQPKKNYGKEYFFFDAYKEKDIFSGIACFDAVSRSSHKRSIVLWSQRINLAHCQGIFAILESPDFPVSIISTLIKAV